MAMKRSGHRPAGGQHSKNVTERPVKVGKRAEEIRHQGVAQIGSSLGNKATGHAGTLRGGVEPVIGAQRPEGSPGGVPLGNLTASQCGQGPGGGREVMRSGGQGRHGPVAGTPKPQGRPILSDFGPDYKGSGRG
jgi:hypothetical protein